MKTPYTRSPRAVALHQTFVANVSRVMREKGWVHPPRSATLAGGQPGQLDIDRLSRASGVPKRTMENIMGANNQPTMVGAAGIAAALGVSLDKLCGMPSTWGFSEPQRLSLTDTSPDLGASTPSRMECIHTSRHTPGMSVCAPCLQKWQSYQTRLRTLYEDNRRARTAEWDAAHPNLSLTPEEKARLPSVLNDPDVQQILKGPPDANS